MCPPIASIFCLALEPADCVTAVTAPKQTDAKLSLLSVAFRKGAAPLVTVTAVDLYSDDFMH